MSEEFDLSNIPWWAWAGLAFLVLKKKKGPPPLPPSKASSSSPPEKIPEVVRLMKEEIASGLQSSAFSSGSKGILSGARDALTISPASEVATSVVTAGKGQASLTPETQQKAFDLLRTLPEDERQAFAMERGQSFGTAKLSRPKGFAMAGWVYVHFGGTSEDLLRLGQTEMGVQPATGILDDATIQAVKNLTDRGIWRPVLKEFGRSL